MSEENSKEQPINSIGKKISIAISTIIILAFIAGSTISYLAIDYYKSPGPLTSEAVIIIPSGSSLKSISHILAENNIIKHPELFTIIVRLSKSGSRMKAGQYKFHPHIAPIQAFGKIASGDVLVHKLTIPEGLMTSQIVELIENAPFMVGDIPAKLKEGDLLPETYDYRYGDTREKIIRRMQTSLDDVLDHEWKNRTEGLPLKSREEALILASIVEKETGVSSERERVSAVFINRLNKGMRLQTDPTVIYAITKGEYVLERPLRYKDLEKQDPYNTYRNSGLPPTPIANPGKASIHAALNPATTNEFYFVADGTGGHQFATTLKEHNANVRNWRRISKAKKKN